MTKEKRQIPCPNCGKPVVWDAQARWRPFCSERCRLIDLGDWLGESNRISEPLDEYQDLPSEQI